jgi:Domain of unknown function (DUF222)
VAPSNDSSAWQAPGCAAGPHRVNRILRDSLRELAAAMDVVGGLSLLGLSDDDITVLLDEATRAVARATALVTATAAEADRRRLGDQVGARNLASWWAHRSRLTRGEAGRLVALGRELEHDLHAPIGAALARGELHADQAGVIVRAVNDLPADLPDEALRGRARDHLLAAAADHDARTLRILGRRILDIIAPQVGERHEQRLLERDEQSAAAAARFSMVDDGHGRCHGRFTLPSLYGEMLRTHLLALANPRRPQDSSEDRPVGAVGPAEPARAVITPERLGAALMEYVERYPSEGLPGTAGIPTTLTVTLSLESLISGLGAASLDTGARISAGEARRLACEAGLVPAVLGGAQEVLDLGRKSRLFTTAQRRALHLRDGGCTAEGCGLPPSVCHAHHDDPWSRGGPTDLAQGRLLCPRHHRLAHDSRYRMTHHPGRTVSFNRRT